jgi:hypothetical protein
VTPEQFDCIIDGALSIAPNWFSPRDPPPTGAQIAAAEVELGMKVPPELSHFWSRYGSGYFGQINVCSARPDSRFYWANCLARSPSFFVVTDDQTGAYYGFLTASQFADKRLYFLDEDLSVKLVAESLFDFVIQEGLPDICRR